MASSANGRPSRGGLRAITPPKPIETPPPLSSPTGFTTPGEARGRSSGAAPLSNAGSRAHSRSSVDRSSPQRREGGINRSLLLGSSAPPSSPPVGSSQAAPPLTYGAIHQHMQHLAATTVKAETRNTSYASVSGGATGTEPSSWASGRPKLSFLAQQSAIRGGPGDSTPKPSSLRSQEEEPLETSSYAQAYAAAQVSAPATGPQVPHAEAQARFAPNASLSVKLGALDMATIQQFLQPLVAPKGSGSSGSNKQPANPPLPPTTAPTAAVPVATAPAHVSTTQAVPGPSVRRPTAQQGPAARTRKSPGEGGRRVSPAATRAPARTGTGAANSRSGSSSPQQLANSSKLIPMEGRTDGAMPSSARAPEESGSQTFYNVVEALQDRIKHLEHEVATREEKARSTEHHKVSARLGELELQVADLLQALEAEKLRSAEAETAFVKEKRRWEELKAEWQAEKRKLVSEAESGYMALFSNITDKAQEVITRLRAELKTALQKVEATRTQALEEAQALVKAADAAREESVARTVHSYERLIAQLRFQIEQQNGMAATQMETLQKEVLERIRVVEHERRAFQSNLETASQASIDEAAAEVQQLRDELARERKKIQDLNATMEQQIQARCQAFEMRLREKMATAVSEARKMHVSPENLRTPLPALPPKQAAVAPMITRPVPSPPPSGLKPKAEPHYDPEEVAKTVSGLKDLVATVWKNGLPTKPADSLRSTAPTFPISPTDTPLSTSPQPRPTRATNGHEKLSSEDGQVSDALQDVLSLMTDEERKTWESLRAI